MQLQQLGSILRWLLMTVLNQGALTPFCYHENHFTVRGVRILMADHCYDVPVAGSCSMKRLVSRWKGQAGEQSSITP